MRRKNFTTLACCLAVAGLALVGCEVDEECETGMCETSDAGQGGEGGGAGGAGGGIGGAGGGIGGAGGGIGGAGGGAGGAGGGVGGAGGGAGGVGGEGGFGGEGGAGGAGDAYRWLSIVDISDEQNTAGTPGADICGVIAECDGASVAPVGVQFDQGEGMICEEIIEDECSAPRNDPNAALDDGSSCDPASAPVSDYISIGQNGVLSIDFGQDLAGCTVTVIEHEGSDAEAYELYVCQGVLEGCLNDDGPISTADEGGNHSADVPF